METTSAIGLKIEDYYGSEIDTIYFEQTIDIDCQYFNGRVNSFVYSGNEEDEDEGIIIRIQFQFEESSGDCMEIEVIKEQIMEIILEGCNENLEFEDMIREKLIETLELIV
jgi:uncharacterized protein YaiE (UPF0345 family)